MKPVEDSRKKAKIGKTNRRKAHVQNEAVGMKMRMEEKARKAGAG